MKLYLISEDDTRPDACRSTYNPTRFYLARKPGQTNLSHENREAGWLGNTGGIDRHALGAIDLDTEGWPNDVANLLPGNAEIDAEAIRRWAEADPANDEISDDGEQPHAIEIRCRTRRGTRAATWDEESEDDWFPTPREGYRFIAGEDSNSEIVGLDDDEESALREAAPPDEDGVCAIAEAMLNAVGVWCERITHETYNSSTNGTDWDYVAIADVDEDRAATALHAAAALVKLDIAWSVILAMLGCLRPAAVPE